MPGDANGQQPASGMPVMPQPQSNPAPGNSVDEFQARIDALKKGGGGDLL